MFHDNALVDFGVFLKNSCERKFISFKRISFIGAFYKAFSFFCIILLKMIKSIWLLFSFQVPFSHVGGPIMILDLAGQAVSVGFFNYIYLMSVISINLGLLKLLPIPVLDGGYLMFFAIERLRRKSVSYYSQELIFQIGVWIIFLLMFYSFFNDLIRIFL